MHLYLIRHGQSFVNLKDWQQGNVDVGLTELGHKQAAALGVWMAANVPTIDALYASTMLRTRETVDHLSQAYSGFPVVFDDRMREVGNNRLDHTPWPNDALPQEWAEYWSTSRPYSPIFLNTPQNMSESFMHFRIRVGAFVEELVEKHVDQNVVVLTHGGVVEAAFDHIFNMGPWRTCAAWDSNTGVTYFQYFKDSPRERWALHYHNSTAHLAALEITVT